jgi:hypothetical protein
VSSCVDPFEPEVISSPTSFLVVDGFINLRGVTTIRLSRTQNIAAIAPPPVEAKAAVVIRDDAGASYPLTEQAPGTYTSQALTLNPSRKYQLQLRTAQNRRYVTDLVTGKLTPAIDQLPWELGERGVQINVNSRDDTGNSRYYRWTYSETWQFRSAHLSFFEFSAGAIRPRTEDIHNCWATANSSNLYLSSTTKLSQDVVSNFPLILLPTNSVKLRFKYSVLVSQYALSPEEYSYLEKLKKNTESIGTLFDPLPTQLTGNAHCLDDANETVIGYVGAASVSQQRIFIAANTDLPLNNSSDRGYPECTYLDTIPVSLANNLFRNPSYQPVFGIYAPNGVLVAYTSSSLDCVDCRRRGTNVRPDFWR